jgi:hypothetical protein
VKRAAVLVLFVLLLAGCSVGRGCRNDPPPPPTATFPPPPTPKVTPTVTSTNVPITATATGLPSASPTTTRTPARATPTPDITTATPTRPISTATPDLLGHHLVVQGDTMHDIGLWWYRGRRFDTSAAIWGPICEANPHIENCRMIYIGDILAIPALP